MVEQMRIVAIGGGGPVKSARALINTALDMTGVDKPSVLYIPTPKYSQDAYNSATASFLQGFEIDAGLPVKVLHGHGELPTIELTEEMLDWADAIYVSGGSPKYAMEVWKAAGIADILSNAVATGKVVASGISAGMIAWFTSCHSDSLMYEANGEPWNYIEVPTLDLVDGLGCPHYNTNHPQTGKPRSQSFAEMMFGKEAGYVGWGVDNLAALQIVGLTAKVLSADGSAMAHKLIRTSHGVKNIAISPTDGLFTI